MKHIASFIIAFGILMSAQAQEPLSLSEAIATGLERNYDIRIEQKNVTIAENNNAWGETGILPTISLGLQSQNSIRNQESDNQFFGGQLFPGFELNDQRSYGLTPVAQVNWKLFQGSKAIISKRRLEQLQAESMQNAEIVVANTLQAIILAYYMSVLEKERLDEYKKQLNLSRDRYEYVKTRYDIGGAVSSDLLLEENNYLTDSANYVNQQLAYHNVLRDLNTLLVSDDLSREYQFTDSLLPDEENYVYEDLRNAMFSQNVDLKKIYISQSVLQSQVRQQRADMYPTVDLNAGYQWNRNVSDLTNARYVGPNTDYQSPPEPLVSYAGTYFANFTLNFNLYNGGKVKRAIRNSVVQEDIGNIKIDQLKTTLERDLQQAFERYQIRKQLYGINARRERAAEINLQLSEEKFKNGSINSFDYRVVQNNYLSASVVKLQSMYELLDSKVELMRLTGGLIEEYKEE